MSLLPLLLVGLGIFFYIKNKKSKVGVNTVKKNQVDKNNPGYKLNLTAKILMVISVLGSIAWMICGIVMLGTDYWNGVHSFGIYWESESHLKSTGLMNLIFGLVCGIVGVILSSLLSQYAKGKTKEFEGNTLLIKTLKDTSNNVSQDSMEKLNSWLKQGYITEEEYQKKKEEILNKL